jgi:NADPH:quinone reductase-like Zn-dependent oxidoreductase
MKGLGKNFGMYSGIIYTTKATTVLQKRELVEGREPEMDIENMLYESNFVGTVTNIDSKASQSSLVRGDQVTSIRKCGTKARFVTMSADSLVVLPENLDMGEAVSVVSIFLPAFGALHHGRRECRFLPNSLHNKKVLVTGGTLLEAQAVVKLAIWGGASAVYMLSSATRVPIKVEGSSRVTVLPNDKEIWLPVVRQKMDVVVDYDFPNNFGSVTKALGLNGRLVCQSKSRSKGRSQDWLAELQQGFMSEFESALEMTTCIMSNSFLFNFEGICDNNTGELEVSQYRLEFD